MALLKKIKSATLVEALVATVLVVVIFVIASLILNNLVLNTYSKKNHSVEFRLNELEYKLNYNKIVLPYKEEYEEWEIAINQENKPENGIAVLTATNKNTDNQIMRKRKYAN